MSVGENSNDDADAFREASHEQLHEYFGDESLMYDTADLGAEYDEG